MAQFKVGIIGLGRPRGTEGATGFGMAHFHAKGYTVSPDAEIVAVADINPVNVDLFQKEHNVPRGYLSADEMLENEDLDIVSICLWPHLHAPMTIKAARAGVKAIHCEKPMAITYGEAREMVAVCEEHSVQLTFDHQRRFGPPFLKAKALLKEGAIGDLERLEAYTDNLYDWGTHWFDMLFFYNDEIPVEWVIGQIDARGSRPIFGAMVEGQGLSLLKFKNGVAGLMVTGRQDFYQADPVRQSESLRSVNCANRLIGTLGTIEVGVEGGPDLRYRNQATGGEWRGVALVGGMHGDDLYVEGVLDLIDALKTGREPELSGQRALRTTELIFATYESSRRRARVDLPLTISDGPLMAMLDGGDITTWPDAYVEANGIQMHYWRTGDGSKPAVVLAHGFSDNGLCWTPVARALERDYDVLMVDARGHGLTDAPETGYTTPDRAADLAAFVQALGLEKPAVLGHSMGASTAAAAAADFPDLFGKVLLEDPAWWHEDDPHMTMTEDESQLVLKEQQDRIIAQKRLSREALIELCREQSPTWQEAELGPWAISKQLLSPYVVTGWEDKPKPWREIAAEITASTLLITADTDKGSIVTPEIAERAQQLNARIEVAHIAGVGHNIRREAFDAFMDVVKDFLAR